MKASLLQGDCLQLLPSLADGSVDLVCADLPYAHVVGGRVRKCTANKWDKPIDLAALWPELLRVGKRNAAFVFTATFDFAVALRNSQPKLKLHDAAWDKISITGGLNAKRQPLRRHELLLVFYRQQPCYNPQMLRGRVKKHAHGVRHSSNYGQQADSMYDNRGLYYPASIISINARDVFSGQHRTVHPTQKPVALLEWLVKTYSNPGDTVLDPCFGSGTTAVACANTGRDFVGMELDPGYCASAQQRLAQARSAVSRETVSQSATPS